MFNVSTVRYKHGFHKGSALMTTWHVILVTYQSFQLFDVGGCSFRHRTSAIHIFGHWFHHYRSFQESRDTNH